MISKNQSKIGQFLISLREIYKEGTFKIKSDYVIKTVEETLSIQQNEENLHLVPLERIDMHKSKYEYMHIGLVQVVMKPLTRIGFNTSCLSYVRDKRHESVKPRPRISAISTI